MKNIIFVLGILFVLLQACGPENSSKKKAENYREASEETVTDRDATVHRSTYTDREVRTTYDGSTIEERFTVPEGYKRIKIDSPSFSHYLRNLPLKPIGSPVTYFNGETKPNRGVYEAVVDLDIGKRDLHQCADAVMRLRAEYLYNYKKYDSIHFNFTNGFRADYSRWMQGQRIAVDGNDVRWTPAGKASTAYPIFWKYLEMVFSYAGTASLEKELKTAPIEELRIGDIFIQGGFPGHAVIVVDVAENNSMDEKVFLLAQSYMPAQELQLLKNPNSDRFSPWYHLSKVGNELRTPEWNFSKNDLKRF